MPAWQASTKPTDWSMQPLGPVQRLSASMQPLKTCSTVEHPSFRIVRTRSPSRRTPMAQLTPLSCCARPQSQPSRPDQQLAPAEPSYIVVRQTARSGEADGGAENDE